MSSGVAVSDECKTYFEDIKKAKKYRYVVFYIKEEKSIVVESVGDRDSSYDDYLNDLQKGGDGECRYGLYDYEYEHQCQGTTESSKKQKLFLMAWCPDSAKIKKKMLYSSSFDALKKSLVGVHKFIQATDLSEASEGEVSFVFKTNFTAKIYFPVLYFPSIHVHMNIGLTHTYICIVLYVGGEAAALNRPSLRWLF